MNDKIRHTKVINHINKNVQICKLVHSLSITLFGVNWNASQNISAKICFAIV